MTRTAEDNAREYGELSNEEGWPFAVLVACSVEKGVGNGGNPSVTRVTDEGKISARRFAEIAGTGAPRVLRYLAAWDKAAAEGLVPPSADLAPSLVRDIELPEGPISKFYPADESGMRLFGPDRENRQQAIREQARLDGVGESKAVNIASNTKAMATAIKADPVAAEAARTALAQRPAEERAQHVRQNLADPEIADKVIKDPETAGHVSRAQIRREQARVREGQEWRERNLPPETGNANRRLGERDAQVVLGQICDRFAKDLGEALPGAGVLAENERFWLTGARDRAANALAALSSYLEKGPLSDEAAEILRAS
jgi:hypothetical protein